MHVSLDDAQNLGTSCQLVERVDTRAEAIRDGASAIDLVDGQELAELLKRYELGVKTVMVGKVVVDGKWLGGFE